MKDISQHDPFLRPKLYAPVKDFVSGTLIKQKEESVSSDSELINDSGKKFLISDKLLGHGSFGDVYLASNENGKKVAVKCCDIDSTGIPNILEASIMGSMIHPYLNRAIRIQGTKTKLYIIQDLAKCDLAQKTRKEKGNYKPGIEELRKWCFQTAQGVLALHAENIIHADIKANNILLYADGTVKLTDFTLATKKWDGDEKFTHNVCTCTHRPLECLMKDPWDESLDIWSLGCTFYEIAYGEVLFPYQGVLEPDQKIKDKESRTRLRNRSVNAIIDWSNRKPGGSCSVQIPQYPIDYVKFKLSDEFRNNEMRTFNKMITWMLTVDPEKRPTISQIIKHPFFTDMKPSIYLCVKRPTNRIDLAEHTRVVRSIKELTSDENIQSLGLNIYCKCNNLNKIKEGDKVFSCLWIASKLILGYPLTIPEGKTLEEIIETEIAICHNLLFRLHSI